MKSEFNKYYDQIDKAIKSYEQFRPCHSMSPDKICLEMAEIHNEESG